MPSHHLLCTLSPSISFFLLLFIFFFSVSFHGVRSAFSTICDPVSSSFLCGNVTVRYPFWNDSDAVFQCGYPGLGLECPYGYHYPILYLPGDAYFVTDINYDDETLTLIDIDVTDVADQGCPRARHNLTLGSLPLSYNSADVNLTFFFNCSAPPGVPIGTGAIDCLLSGDERSYVFVNMSRYEEAAFDELWDCEETVVEAVKGTEVTAANVVERYAGAMSQGFVLDWEVAKECGACEHSGGRCAFNQTKQVQCSCNDESIHADGSACKGHHLHQRESREMGPIRLDPGAMALCH